MVNEDPREAKVPEKNLIKNQSTTESTPIHPITEAGGSSQITPRVDKGKGIATKTDSSASKLIKASREVQRDLNALVLIH
ncbi:hypothetical protein Tco_1357312 [Tanacetum coccineum]